MSHVLERNRVIVSGAVKYRLQPLDCREACSRAHIAQADINLRYRRYFVERKRFGYGWERLEDKEYTPALLLSLSHQPTPLLLMSADMVDVANAMHG